MARRAPRRIGKGTHHPCVAGLYGLPARCSWAARAKRPARGPGSPYALAEAMDDGHCGLPHDELRALAAELLELPAEIIDQALALELALELAGGAGGGRHRGGAGRACS